MTHYLKLCLGLLVISLFPSEAPCQILQLAELNTNQIRALDRTKTVVLIPGGILEQHGPYLPSFTDGYVDLAVVQELARAIVARPGWTALIFPPLPIGFGGANDIGGKWSFPGSYTVRTETLRAVYMDLSSELGEQGFRWIFLVNDHGDPLHARALNQASSYFHEIYGGTMVHLRDLMPIATCCGVRKKCLRPRNTQEGFSIHAGAGPTVRSCSFTLSWLILLSRVRPRSPPKGLKTSFELRSARNGPVISATPRLASAALGARELTELTRVECDLVLKILDGLDYRTIPRFSDQFDPNSILGLAAD